MDKTSEVTQMPVVEAAGGGGGGGGKVFARACVSLRRGKGCFIFP